MGDLDELMDRVWPQVRRRHLFPELARPQWIAAGERVAIRMKGKTICVSRDFVLRLSKVMDRGDVLEALLDHAVSHYLYCPWDFATHLGLYREAKKVLHETQLAQMVTDYFVDIVADTRCLSQMDSPLPDLYRRLPRGGAEEAILALYQTVWGVDLGVRGHETMARRLARLPYLDRRRWPEAIQRFAREVGPLFRREKSGAGVGEPNPMSGHGLDRYSPREVEQGLRDLAMTVSPLEFREIVHDLTAGIRGDEPPAAGGMGLGLGSSFQADILYYMRLAENYSLPMRPAPMKKTGSLYPHQHLPWELGRPYQDIDPWASFGKILPGITKTWERREMEVSGEKDGIPDCLILMDSSGSMTNPHLKRSFAVLGAACVGDAYLRNGAKVAVYNFSDAQAGAKVCLPFTDQRLEIYRTLCTYFGGGTSLSVEDVDALQEDRLPDLYLITDMQVVNLELLIQYFNHRPNRVTALHIGNNEHVAAFRKSTALTRNITLCAVEKEADIPHIVLGKVRDYLCASP